MYGLSRTSIPLEEAHGNAGTCFSTSVTNCIWQYLNLLNKKREDSGACGRHQYFSAALAPTEEQLLATLIVKTEKCSKSVISQS